jgi:NADP-dependent 3-hydroxy acid dehydrogenase YdfG
MIEKSRMATRVLTKVADVTDKNQVENMVKSIVKHSAELTFQMFDQQCRRHAMLRAKGSSETLDSDDLRSLLDLNVASAHIVTAAIL